MPWTAIATGAAGLFGGLGQAYSADRYLKGVRETNEQNYQIWQEQQQHNIDMFNLENDANVRNWQNQFDQTNAYNTASAQRQRLEEAGLNPAMMMNGGNAGVASSSGIPSATAQPAQAPQMQAPQMVQSGLSAFADNVIKSAVGFAQALDLDSQRNARDELLPVNIREAQSRIGLNDQFKLTSRADQRLKESDWEAKWLDREYQRRTLEDRIAYQSELHKGMILKNVSQWLSNEAQQISNQYLPVKEQAQIALLGAQYFSQIAAGKLSLQQAKTELTKQILNRANANVANTQAALNTQLKNESEKRSENIEADTKQKGLDYQKAELLANDYIEAMQSEYNYNSMLNRSGSRFLSNPYLMGGYNLYRYGFPKPYGEIDTGGSLGIDLGPFGFDVQLNGSRFGAK